MNTLFHGLLCRSTYQAAADRFLKTGGMPAAPAKMLGRWHGLAAHGYALVQSKDPSAVFAWGRGVVGRARSAGYAGN